MLSALITKAFWVKVWEWCKINWKFLLGISIPVIISILMRKGNAAKIFQKASEVRKEQLEILEKSTAIEAEKKKKAQKEFIETTKNVLDTHDETMKKIAAEEKKTIAEIDSAEKATSAIKKKLGE